METYTYRTISGDTFDIIAKKELGDEMLAVKVIEQNPDYADVIFFQSGVELQIPDPDEIEDAREDLPPWKRGD